MNRFAFLQRLLLAPVLGLAVAGLAPAQPANSAPNPANTAIPATALHHGAIALGSWNTAVEFKDVVVTSNEVVLYRSDFAKEGTNGWTVLDGDWSVRDGVLRQTAIKAQCRAVLGDTNWANYTVTLRARRTGGQEGFFVYFNFLDRNHWTWFDVGGWTNTLSSIDTVNNGAWSKLGEPVPQTLENNVWHDVRVVLDGTSIECYLDSKLVKTGTYSNSPPINVAAASANASAASGKRNAGVFNPTFHGAVGVGAWDTQTEFRNIVVTSNNVVLYRSDFDKENIDAWHTVGGSWIITNGVLRQTEREFGCFATIGDTNWCNYTLTLQARKLSGDEGFIAVVGWIGDGNLVWLNAGSWGNHDVEIYQDTAGRRGTLTPMTPLIIETGKWYDVRVVLDGAQVSCYLNSNLVQTATANVVVSTNALYLGSVPMSDGTALRFKVGKDEFRGHLTKDRGGPPALEIGSLVQVTGTIQPGLETTDPDSGPSSEIQLFSPTDVVLLQPPSWWTWQRILIIGSVSLAFVAIAVTWIAMISRKNRLLTIAHRQLQRANDELELRVQDRTADLAQANTELKHEQALFRTLLDGASDCIYFKDTDSKFVRCSVSTCRKSGLTHERIVGKTDFDLFEGAHAREAFAEEQEIIRTGQPLTGKLEREVHPDGRVTWAMTTKMPWRDPDGRIIGTFGISRDITSIKQAEADLERTHKQLLETSRAAGMAEVATGVLHNVGNVLNSVNVTSTLLADQLKKSKTRLVGQVAALMKDHAADLGDFMTRNPQGQRVPQFLWDLSEQLEHEQTLALEELAGLQKNVGHIKGIVAMQQSYATVAGLISTVSVAELLDDVLRLTESSLIRHEVKLVKEFDPRLPDINVDRHKVLQILVNLVRNAKHACQDAPQPDKQLTLRASVSSGSLKISVIDNGVGIPAENLTRIFAHGFTTRNDGHGFGLHSSALAAREIGGKLLVHSDGSGKGAAFTLELPLAPEADPGVPNMPAQPPAVAATA